MHNVQDGEVRNIQEQIRDAFERSRLSMVQLLELAHLDLDVSSLSRKIHGKQSLRVEEAEAIARALGIRIVAGRRGVAA